MRCCVVLVGLVLWAAVAWSEPGVILHQTHRFSGRNGVDTLRTYITRNSVRIEHAQGDAILDLQEGRLILLDRKSRTWRQMPLDDWEEAIRRAAQGATGQTADGARRPPLAFERAGASVERAGYLCDRWSLFTRRELLPGEVDWVEQHLWVARDLELPDGAYEAYERAIRALDSIGMGTIVERPRGVVLASEIRSGTEAEHERGEEEVELTTVVRVEKRELAADVFRIPASYRPAVPEDDTEVEAGKQGRKKG